MVATNVKEDGEPRKIALLAHSWGDSVARAFFLWSDHKVRRRGERELSFELETEREMRDEKEKRDLKTKACVVIFLPPSPVSKLSPQPTAGPGLDREARRGLRQHRGPDPGRRQVPPRPPVGRDQRHRRAGRGRGVPGRELRPEGAAGEPVQDVAGGVRDASSGREQGVGKAPGAGGTRGREQELRLLLGRRARRHARDAPPRPVPRSPPSMRSAHTSRRSPLGSSIRGATARSSTER